MLFLNCLLAGQTMFGAGIALLVECLTEGQVQY